MKINLAFAETGVDLPIGTTIDHKGKVYRIYPYDIHVNKPYMRCYECDLCLSLCSDLICSADQRHDRTYVVAQLVSEEGGDK